MPTPAVEGMVGTSCVFLARAPCRSAHSTVTSYLLSAQVPWLVQERVTCSRQREALLFFAFVCVKILLLKVLLIKPVLLEKQK